MAEERYIEYEVEGHPWASEEGCAPRCAELDAVPVVGVRMTHAEAATRLRDGSWLRMVGVQ